MTCNFYHGKPAVYTFTSGSFPAVVSLDSLNGFAIITNGLAQRTQFSVKWCSFFHVAGFVVFFNESDMGIGIIKGSSFLYSLTSVSLDKIFDVSDVEYSKVILSRVGISPDKKNIVVTTVCNYGDNILVSSWGTNIKGLATNSNGSMTYDGLSGSDLDWSNEEANSDGSMFEVNSEKIDVSNGDDWDLTKKVQEHHVNALNSFSDDPAIPNGTYNSISFFIGNSLYYAMLKSNSVIIYNCETEEVVSWDTKDEAYGKANVISNSIKMVPKISNGGENISNFYTIKLKDGVYVRYESPNFISFQTLYDNKVNEFSISIEKKDGKDTFSIAEIKNKSTGEKEIIPNVSVDGNIDDFNNIYISELIGYNTSKYIARTGSLFVTDIEDATSVTSLAPIILYN